MTFGSKRKESRSMNGAFRCRVISAVCGGRIYICACVCEGALRRGRAHDDGSLVTSPTASAGIVNSTLALRRALPLIITGRTHRM